MKYRNELKFVCEENDMLLIEDKISKILQLDSHTNKNNRYCIHSLYFDDLMNTCVYDNDAGIGNRYKWRIRSYNNESYLRLERKEKTNGLCRKLSCEISAKQYEAIMNNDIPFVFWSGNDKLLKRFCVEIMCKKFMPKMIIDYERTAYVEPITNIRITFDKNISGSTKTDEFISGNYVKYPLQEKQKHILEVKYDDVLPSYIAQAAHIKTLNQTTFSKYYLARSLIERN